MLTEEQKQAILDEAKEDAFKPKGYGKTTRPKNLLRKRKTGKKITAQSKTRSRPKKLSRRKKSKPLHKRKKRA